ncbi:MAG: LysM peptidoglycan-binding domain-containing protein [Kiritimatiellae bacterium]|nr:LysM peptidoglycan-binding domain-containing protein [Kiritimatiellia bacterium]
MKLNPRNRHIQSAIQYALRVGIPVFGILFSVVCPADIAPFPRQGKHSVAAGAKPGERFHIVRHGETLSGIAVRYGVSQRAILRLNNMPASRADRLRVGQRLRIPVRQPKPPPKPQPRPEPHHVKGAMPPTPGVPSVPPPPPQQTHVPNEPGRPHAGHPDRHFP